MKKWWLAVIVLYVLILIVLSMPALVLLADVELEALPQVFAVPAWWIWLLLMASGAACLLLIPIRAARPELRNRRALAGPIIVTSLFLALMFGLVWLDIALALWGDDVFDDTRQMWSGLVPAIGLTVLMWAWWSVVFLRYMRGATGLQLTRTITRRLLAGSILELLVALPCHIIVRNRNECCAPAGTFMGIAMGLSVMLMAFGPGVLFLFIRRFRRITPPPPSPSSPPSSSRPAAPPPQRPGKILPESERVTEEIIRKEWKL